MLTGTGVRHRAKGEGTVLSVRPSGKSTELLIRFDATGEAWIVFTALLSETLRRTADRPAELLHALRYEQALAYEAAGQPKRARADLERLYAEAPDCEDVAKRLAMPT
jgi:hypothetical protein